MIHAVDPRQNRLFDPFDGDHPPIGRRIIADGWQGVFRHVLLEVMPVAELGVHFSDSIGASHQRTLFHGRASVFLADFFGWKAHDAIEAYIFRSDVQYALNLEPGVEVSTRTVERCQKLFRDNDLAALRLRRRHHPTHTKPSISTSPGSGSTRPMSSATWPASAEPSSWPWRSSGS